MMNPVNTVKVLRSPQELQLVLELLAQSKIMSGEGKVAAGMLQMKVENELRQLQSGSIQEREPEPVSEPEKGIEE